MGSCLILVDNWVVFEMSVYSPFILTVWLVPHCLYHELLCRLICDIWPLLQKLELGAWLCCFWVNVTIWLANLFTLVAAALNSDAWFLPLNRVINMFLGRTPILILALHISRKFAKPGMSAECSEYWFVELWQPLVLKKWTHFQKLCPMATSFFLLRSQNSWKRQN